MSWHAAKGAIRRFARARGFHVVRTRNFDLIRRDYYSPIPNFAELPDDVWDARSGMRGVRFDTGRQLEWAERELAPHIKEMRAPRSGEAGGFFFENGLYDYGDAELAYAIVRRFRPERILELGSGFSTLALGLAASANGRDGNAPRLVANDPLPEGIVGDGAEGVTELRRRSAQEIPLHEFEELAQDDVLFVDTTHVVKMASDVNYVVLEVLPSLQPGVLVHFHDIWLPDEYHRSHAEILNVHWTEQYLLQAFLAFNQEFEVLFATHAVARDHAERFEAMVPGYTGATYPTSCWLRRATKT
jgi:hypothetical protein